ncbi:MAG: insulinase family protein [bacterium]|nr:insulinase family protein [bacterium]
MRFLTDRGAATAGLLLALFVLGAVASTAQAGDAMEIDIPHETFVLGNGLTLIVHEDRKAPIVAVNVWYHVGSKNEKPGRTGFAHLFEHLMFNGSENFDDDYFQAMARIGATDLNGTTNNDRTNYFQNVPTSAIDSALWMESDRMGHLLGVVTQEKLDEQRGVVQNEKRQGENQPYAKSRELITKSCYPEGHPYSWTVIGSMDDLDAAALDDVHQWFKGYYGAANAVVVVAGDIDAKTAKAKVERFFGDIPSGPPVDRPDIEVAKRSESTRTVVQDRVPHARIYKVWNVPQFASHDHELLELVSGVLTSGKNSRLYKRLVYDEQIARSVTSYVGSREIGSLFQVIATAQPGVDLAQVEAAVDEELARLIAEGPTAEELERVKTDNVAGFIRGIERIGGFGGKSDILAYSQVYGGRSDYYKTALAYQREATAADVQRVARDWLSAGDFNLEIHPFPQYAHAEASDVDRSKLPEPGEPPKAQFVKLDRATLSNGMKLIVASRHATPIVDFDLLIDAGYAADKGAAPGTAKLAMDMLDEGAGSRDALEIADALTRLGAELGTGSNLDMSSVSLSAIKANLDESLELYADVILKPTFPENEFDRLKKQQLTTIESEKSQPVSMALRVFPGLLYGRDHAYGTPFTGSGSADTVSRLTRKDLQQFHGTWFKPNNATLVVVGDTTMSEIKPKLEKLFKGWKKGNTPKKDISTVAQKSGAEVYLIDKPGAIQSVIFAGHVAPPRGAGDDVAAETMNTILGGSFISRLNMNLREDKHWSYGARTLLLDARGQRPFLAFAPVQTDKTKESMIEIQKELDGIRGGKPVTAAELSKIKNKKVLELPGSWETNGAVLGSITEIVRFDLNDGYFDTYADKVSGLSLEQVSGAAAAIVQPDKLVWVIVGDREKIEAGIRELGYGEIKLMDADGNQVDGTRTASQAKGVDRAAAGS